MSRFTDFFDQFKARITEADDLRHAMLPEIVQLAGFRYWRPTDFIPKTGLRVLICVGSFSRIDMMFLDAIYAAQCAKPSSQYQMIDVFDMLDCATADEFRHYFPMPTNVSATPFLGLWRDGQFVSCGGPGYSYGIARDQLGATV